MGIRSLVRKGWDIFSTGNQEATRVEILETATYSGGIQMNNPRARARTVSERTILSSILNRISIDASEIELSHVRLDDDGRYLDKINSGLNTCLNVEANIDQAATAFKRDMVMTMLEQGVIAIVPVETSFSPYEAGGYDIRDLRVGIITEWFPKHVRASVYNDRIGQREEILIPKDFVGIVENPLYPVMNEPNSTYQRLVRKLNLLDIVDEQSASGNLDLIIQLPYATKTTSRREDANRRLREIEAQMKNSQYGIAYIDSTEHITQLNRPSENNLAKQVKDLHSLLYTQLGVTPEILNGTADDVTMTNYNSRTIKPIVNAIAEELERKFLTKTARAQKQAIRYFQNPFELAPITKIAEMAETFTRNEILSSNEMRAAIGAKPSANPRSNELVNKNMPHVEPTAEEANSSSEKPSAAKQPVGESVEQFIEQFKDVTDFRKT